MPRQARLDARPASPARHRLLVIGPKSHTAMATCPPLPRTPALNPPHVPGVGRRVAGRPEPRDPPANHTNNLFAALEHQDPLQRKYTGGTVFHVYLGERMPDKGSVKTLVRRIMENHKLPYITITPTFSVCSTHGYVSGEHETCPTCGKSL